MPQSSFIRPCGTLRFLRPAAAALVALSLASGCSERDSTTVAQTPRPSGQQLFVEKCASCHGTDGRGDGPLASELRSAPINLRLLAQENDGKFPSRRVQSAIDGRGMPNAHGLPEMPVWGTVWKRQGLSEAQVRAQILSVASYVNTLQD